MVGVDETATVVEDVIDVKDPHHHIVGLHGPLKRATRSMSKSQYPLARSCSWSGPKSCDQKLQASLMSAWADQGYHE